MCARYWLLRRLNAELLSRFGIEEYEDSEYDEFDWRAPRYDIRIANQVPIVRNRLDAPDRELTEAQWSLIPHWSRNLKPSKTEPHPFNIVGETMLQKPMFAVPMKAGRRCAIPASGYIEWTWTNQKKREGTRYLVTLKDDEPFAFAGLWNSFELDDRTIRSTAFVTTEPNPLARQIHHRQPVMLRGEEIDRWLDPSIKDPALLMPMMHARASEEIEIRPGRLDSDNTPENVEPTGPPMELAT